MKKIKILHVVGARPQFVKMALVMDAAKSFRSICSVVAHTGQHYDRRMSDIFFSELKMAKPKYCLGIGSGSHTKQIGGMINALGKVMLKEAPDVVYVYGDTNSTLAGAIAATKMGIPLAHVEAGLRSFNRTMPEETNRIMTDSVSDILFCPTKTAVDNLRKEGISNGVFRVEDVMLDMIIKYSKIAHDRSDILKELGLKRRSYYLATVHRSYNTDDTERLRSIIRMFDRLDKSVVFPVHPRTRKVLSLERIKLGRNIIVTEPVSYIDMLMLEMNSSAILTDSGGVQKEAFFLKVPCVTLREETEWVETVMSGWNVLAGVDVEKAINVLRKFSASKFYAGNRSLPDTGRSSARKMLEITLDFLRGKR